MKETANEILDAELREVGCPYDCNDYRARIWLDGFSACLKHEQRKLAERMPA